MSSQTVFTAALSATALGAEKDSRSTMSAHLGRCVGDDSDFRCRGPEHDEVPFLDQGHEASEAVDGGEELVR